MRAVLAYGTHAVQHGELFTPDGAVRGTAVVIHGGFWRAPYDRRLMDPVCLDLARRGWAAWSVEYRRVGLLAGGGWPNTLLDVAAAVDHLAVLAGEDGVGLPPEPVVAIGHSAGGQLALWTAARSGLPPGAPGARPTVRPQAVFAQAAVSDLEAGSRLRLGGGAVDRFLGRSARRAERTRLASPSARLPLGVRQVLVHGAADEVVPASMSERYAAGARAAGDAAELVVLDGVGHFEHLDPGSAAWAAVAQRLPA